MTKKKCAVILTIVSIVLFIAYSQLNAETVEKDINTEDFLSQVEDISAWMKKINTEKENKKCIKRTIKIYFFIRQFLFKYL